MKKFLIILSSLGFSTKGSDGRIREIEKLIIPGVVRSGLHAIQYRARLYDGRILEADNLGAPFVGLDKYSARFTKEGLSQYYSFVKAENAERYWKMLDALYRAENSTYSPK